MSNEQSEVTQANAIDTQKIIDELALNSCSLNSNAEDFVKHIRSSSDYITQIISNLEKCVKHQDEVLVKMSSELRMLVLIPEKMQTRINEIVPQIATEVEKIYSSKVELLEQKSESIEDKIAKSVTNHDEKITETTNNAITLLKDKIEQFTTSLMRDANLTASDNRTSFFKQIGIMVIFSAIVSSIMSYVVMTQFPRYVEIKGANDISVYDSKVQLWGGTVKSDATKDEKTKNK